MRIENQTKNLRLRRLEFMPRNLEEFQEFHRGTLITVRNKNTWRDILWGRVPGRTGDTVGRSREMSQKGSIVVDTPLHTC
jgi:hypothetical protein